MAKFRGSKGSLTIGGNSVAQITGWEMTFSRPFLDQTSMGDAHETGALDTPASQGRCTAWFDYADPAQAELLDALQGDADVAPIAAVFVVSSTGPKQIAQNVLPTSAQLGARRGETVQVTFDLRGVGPATPAWT